MHSATPPRGSAPRRRSPCPHPARPVDCSPLQVSPRRLLPGSGEVSEWLKEHAWKVCKRLKTASRVRIPPSPPETQTAPSRGRLRFRGAGRVDERACGFDKRAGQPVWTAEGRPRAARVRAMDGAHPSRPPPTQQRPSRGRLRFCGAGRVDERACGFDKRAGQPVWTAEGRPRAARVRAMDGAHPSRPRAPLPLDERPCGFDQSEPSCTNVHGFPLARERRGQAFGNRYPMRRATGRHARHQSASISPSARINRRARLSGFDSGGWKPARSAARSARACSRARREASDSL